jgi:hypothetical protein
MSSADRHRRAVVPDTGNVPRPAWRVRSARVTARPGAVSGYAVEVKPEEENAMPDTQSNDPLHGVTLETMLRKLVNKYGWPGLAKRIDINCFKSDPSIASSLKFLRKTPWARKEVEELFRNSKFWTKD